MRWSPLYQMTLTKLRELLREPEALFWVFVFPVLLALALGIAFRSKGPDVIPVGVQEGQRAGWIAGTLEASGVVRPAIVSEAEARRDLRAGRLALVVVPGERRGFTYWLDPTRPDSRLAELTVDDLLQRGAGRKDARPVSRREMTERGSRYIDFLIPGLLGMNLMGTGMWGVGFYIVNARSRHLLKRFVATPMRRSQFLMAQIAGRLAFLVLEVGVLLGFAHFAFDVPLRGSVVVLGLVCLLGAMTFSGLGLLVAARPRTIEGVSGLVNLTMMPMWIFSGVFFSTSRFPDAVQPLIQVLPLTAINDALRAVMLEGSSLVAVAGELAVAAVWGIAAFSAALVLFRWN